MTTKVAQKMFLVLLYSLAFILLREWLIPVVELSNMDYLIIFLLFIVLAFICSLARFKWPISASLKVFYMIWAIHYMYYEKVLFSIGTVRQLFLDVLSNFSFIVHGEWLHITNPFRTLLFFILLWMTAYLIRHWIEVRQSILLFYAMTVIFIAFLDTFSSYSADGAIVRVMVSGLLLLGILTISRLARKNGKAIFSSTFVAIAASLVCLVAVSVALATILPNQAPLLPDPVPYFLSAAEKTGENGGRKGISKSGYDPDDSVLGGSFVKDDTLVFEAEVDRKQYWKVETKNTYTSKGWVQQSVREDIVAYSSGMEMGEVEHSGVTDSEQLQVAQITMFEKFPFLIYPYGVTKAFVDGDVQFLHHPESGQYRTIIGQSEVLLDSYGAHFVENNYSLKGLRATTMDSFSKIDEDLGEYLQLPDVLPERVRDLAASITEKQESVYDKAKEIERYFARNGFVYDQKNVAIPEENDDYVDQFLFDTKKGYCDNFSTSMVVLLRTIGIPARWVKGFAPGETSKNAEGERIYQITNNEAHSWVEAYMPGLGWMPFEPTIGFNGPAGIEYDIELEDNDPAIPERKEQERQQKESQKPKKTEEE